MISQPNRDTLRKKSGLKPIIKPFSLSDVLESNWSYEFIKLQQNRMILGKFRYGAMKDKLNKYDCIGSIKKRIAMYEEDRNLEHLVDGANIFMCEYVDGLSRGQVLLSIDDGAHTEVKEGKVGL